MQKRKFDELISYFNRKVSDMSIDQKYKMELLGMISAIGFAHEKELSTNLASLGTDCISRQAAIDSVCKYCEYYYNENVIQDIKDLPSAQTELCEDAVSRLDAISHFRGIADATSPKEKYNEGFVDGLEFCIAHLSTMPPAQPAPSQVAADMARIVENGKDMRVIEAAQPTPDQNGDLWITVPDIDKVTCIYVQESKSKFCRIFYEER